MTNEQLAFWGFAIYLVVMIAYSSLCSWRLHGWPHLVGKLLRADVEYLNVLDRGSAWEDLHCEYKVAGEKYSGTRLSPLVLRGQVGPRIKQELAKIQYVSKDQILVFFNPKKPSKSYLAKETWLNILG